MRTLVLAALSLGIFVSTGMGCGSDPHGPPDPCADDPDACLYPPPQPGIGDGCEPGMVLDTPPTLAVDIGTLREDGSFDAWTDGRAVEITYGFQGGYMLTPRLRVTAPSLTGETVCLRVAIANALVSEPGGTDGATFTRQPDGSYVSAVLSDLLAWDLLPDGTNVGLEANVQGASFAARGSVTVVIGGASPPEPPPPCETDGCGGFTPLGDGCDYGEVPLDLPASLTVEIGEVGADGSFVAWTDDQMLPIVYGFQGGYMLTPRIRVSAPSLAGDTTCLRIEVQNLDVPVPGGTDGATFERQPDGSYLSYPLNDLLSNAPLGPVTDMVMSAVVRGPDFVAEGGVRLRVTDG
jgi:hypothetical protein